ncbi:hypothetical protein MPSEU_000277800 [Mayamaea pseudoterrestris]|nr:hypothetical protein MPSEU_000277800 [Mayamaea pseudoterrestris]
MSAFETHESPGDGSPPEAHNVSRATYDLPAPLRDRLQAGVLFPEAPESRKNERIVETIPNALAQLVSNSIEAMDTVFFSVPGRVRQHPAFQHRLCIRIRANSDTNTLSLTDLGCGMTRADLINLLGTSKAVPSSTDFYSSTNGSKLSGSDTEEDSTTEDEADVSGDDNDNESTQEHATEGDDTDASAADGKVVDKNQRAQSCLAKDIGGFYAALCSLGTGIRIGTKAKHDDYYEYQVGVFNGSPTDFGNAFDKFSIVRPRGEGTELSVEEGFDQFEDVRGESGTCVSIRLNQEAIDAGLLNEETLKSIFLKIVEATQYTIAFSSSSEASDIISASAKERDTIARLLAEPQDVDPLESIADKDFGTDHKESADDLAYNSVAERAKYIPLRLSLGERKMLRLVEAFMTCCEYTTDVDRPFRSSARRTHEQLKGISSILRGLVVACDFEAGHSLAHDDNLKEYESSFRQMFEIARRHKIMNPEKMRTEYGKLVFVLQDAVSPSVRQHIGFSCMSQIETVYKFLDERNGVALLSDPLTETATQEILAERKSRAQINSEIRIKERSVLVLKKKYSSAELSQDDIHLCLYSICDNNSFLNSNRVPIDKIINYLQQYFSPDKADEGYSLSIVSGEDGARLSHSHERQYYFTLQSLTLWRDIIDDMFRLWAMAEGDLLSESVTYSLQDTGQGFQRVQQSPQTYKAMQRILVRVQSKVKRWVGSSVIHMGDHNVPKYVSLVHDSLCLRMLAYNVFFVSSVL